MTTTNQIYLITIEKEIGLTPREIFDSWRVPGSSVLKVVSDEAFFFESNCNGMLIQNYGRFLNVTPDQHIEMAWMSSQMGGIETNVCVYLSACTNGTLLKLVHAGFRDDECLEWHQTAWEKMFQQFPLV